MKNINKKRLIGTFCELARIKSPSGHEREIAKLLIKKLKSLGLKVVKDNYGNVIAKLSGAGQPLVLCAHMDTVAIGPGKNIVPLIKGNFIRSDGRTILGADNKDSIAAILEVLAVIQDRGLKTRALEIVFTREEEAISKGAKNLDLSLIKGKKCIIADAAYPHGTIILSAPHCYNFEVVIEGKRSHVATPEKGINAAAIAVKALSRIPLGKVDKFTRVNISFGLIGLKGNIDLDKVELSVALRTRNNVPDLVRIFGEVRGAKIELVEKNLHKITSEFTEIARQFKGKAVFSSQKLANGYIYGENYPLVREIRKVFKDQGVKPKYFHSFGGSDANILVPRGIDTIVISSPNVSPHTMKEHLKISDLMCLADFYLKLLVVK